MTAMYNDIDQLIDDVIANRVGIASLSNDLLADLLSRTVEIISGERRAKNTEDFQTLLDKIAVVLNQRAEDDLADDVSSELLASIERGNFCPSEGNFTLH